MTAPFAVAALFAVVLLAVGVGVGAAWIMLGCYPWRRCGRCGMGEWRIFRGRSK